MKTVFIVNPHAGTENNEEKLRSAIRPLMRRPPANCM